MNRQSASKFECDQWLPKPVEEVFAFFSDAANLQRLTPAWLSFRILTAAPIELRRGALIDYRLSIHGLPVRWQTEITHWDPPKRFVDEQRRGPYRLWIHEHRFEPKEGGTLASDSVQYRVPGGKLVERLFVRRDIERIFTFRQKVLAELFSPASEFTEPGPARER